MEIFATGNVLGYIIIFFGKILEVTVATVRMVLINRGERTKGSLLALVDISLWLIISGTVLANLNADIVKAVLYCIAFSLGNYIGSLIENKIALGLSTVQVIIDIKCYQGLLSALRAQNYAVTVVDGKGKEGDKKILFIHLKRSKIADATRLINKINENCVITVSDVRVLRDGFIKK
jgi:uncharacterized protein YebE (UPF0316 family)